MIWFKNFFGHLKTVLTHKMWVCYYCFKVGRYWQGIMHDLSKFHPTEFFESVKYWQGHRSPIDACKEDKGYSMAWYHHRGRNKHHYEYWCDNFEKGLTCPPMPKKYAVELLCDHLGAGRAYNGSKFTFEDEMKWWEKKKKVVRMNPLTIKFIDEVYKGLQEGYKLDKDLVDLCWIIANGEG